MDITKKFENRQVIEGLTLGGLHNEARWCAWQTELRERGPKVVPAKLGYGIDNRWARSNKPDRWMTWTQAMNLLARGLNPELRAGPSGIGILLGDLGPSYGDLVLIGADLDSCLGSDGVLEEWAAEALTALGPVYAEVSPSGTGVKTFMLTQREDVEAIREHIGTRWSRVWKREGGVGEHKAGLELHTGHRWFTVTGDAEAICQMPLGVVGLDALKAYAAVGSKRFPDSGRGRRGSAWGGDAEVTDEMIKSVTVPDGCGDEPEDLTEDEKGLIERLPGVAALWNRTAVLGSDKTGSAELYRLGWALRRAMVGQEAGIRLMFKCPWAFAYYQSKGEWEGRRQFARAWFRHDVGVAESVLGKVDLALQSVGAAAVNEGQVVALRYDAAGVRRLVEAADPSEVARMFAGLAAVADLDPLERESLTVLVAKKAGLAKGVIKEQIKEVKREQKAARAEAGGDWRNQINLNDKGEPLGNLANAMLYLRNAHELVGIVSFDQMMRGVYLNRRVPDSQLGAAGAPQQDNDISEIQEWIQLNGLPTIGRETVQQAINLTAAANAFHPVQQYLSRLAWDGTKRLDTWLKTGLGATKPSDTYLSQVGRMFLLSMVYRIMRPGCQCDYMIVLEGPQGALKTTACNILAGNWFSNSLPDLHGHDQVRIAMHLRGKWLIEIGELSSFKRSEMDKLKDFLTRREEIYTPKFFRNEVTEPRQCVFMGTTNEKTYLKDVTGARRFWPVEVGAIDIQWLKDSRDQLFAEAMAAYRDGAQYWPTGAFETQHIKVEQDARFEVDAWEDTIQAWLACPGTQFINGVWEALPSIVSCTSLDVAKEAVKVDVSRQDTLSHKRIFGIMTRLGWKQDKVRRWVKS